MHRGRSRAIQRLSQQISKCAVLLDAISREVGDTDKEGVLSEEATWYVGISMMLSNVYSLL
jgi:hypothetical protein